MTLSTRAIVFSGLVAASQWFGACSDYTNLGDPADTAGAGGEDQGDDDETGGSGGPSTGSGGSSAETGNGGSSGRGGTAGGGGVSSGGASPGGASAGGGAGSGAVSTGGSDGGGVSGTSGSGAGGSGTSGASTGGTQAGGAGAPTGGSGGDGAMPDGGPPTGCALDACNDHGACIERVRWSLCDCDPEPLPECQLPLFREIGPSRTNEELILVQVSGDGKTIVGSHRPSGSTQPKYGVKWTLDGGLEKLEQAPEGPTIAWGSNFDGSLIKGQVENLKGEVLRLIVWRNGVLGAPSDMDDDNPPRQPRRVPTLAEFDALLEDAGIDAGWWDIWVVNDISDDGKVIFGLGLLPDRGARWLLRLP
jgi:hypothetical protein